MPMCQASTRARKALPVALTFVTAVLAASAAHSQQPPTIPPQPDGVVPSPMFQYAAKFVCGRAAALGQASPPVAPGFYYTALNVHNPANVEVSLRKKFAVALPAETVGKISELFPKLLKADEAMEIDCPDILKHLGMPANAFVKGFAVIQSNRELDIVGVYTAAPSPSGTVVTMAIERVPKRP
jgi:hypothetical protein